MNSVFSKVLSLACGGEHPMKSSYGFMFEKLRNCVETLNDDTYYMGELLKEALEIEDLSHFKTASNVTHCLFPSLLFG